MQSSLPGVDLYIDVNSTWLDVPEFGKAFQHQKVFTIFLGPCVDQLNYWFAQVV